MAYKVFVVEDEGMIALLLDDILNALGHEVAGNAETVNDALAFLEAHQADIAIVDLKLGDEESYPVMMKLKEAGIPFAVASGYGADIDRDRCGMEAGIIPKPYTLPDVERALKSLKP